MKRISRPVAAVAAALVLASGITKQTLAADSIDDSNLLEPGSALLRIENLEGLILVRATLSGERRDTTGLLALDTGAGYLALDQPVAWRLDLVESADPPWGVALAPRALERLELGALRIDHVTPMLTMDAEIVRRVTDRPLLGLIGQRVFTGRALVIDPQARTLRIIPMLQAGTRSVDASRSGLSRHLSADAHAVPFVLAGDGKILVRGAVSDPHPDSMSAVLTWIVDTGATRCVLFEPALGREIRHHARWRAMDGLVAPTLFGDEPAVIARVPQVAIAGSAGQIVESDVETVIIGGALTRSLAAITGERIHGLIGYSFLGRYRVAIDYVNRVLWLDPLPPGWDGRRHRDSQIGIQLERRGTALAVSGVAGGSPAADADIRVGDEIVVLHGTPVGHLDIAGALRRLEGPPGSSVTLTLRRGTALVTHKLLRRRLP